MRKIKYTWIKTGFKFFNGWLRREVGILSRIFPPPLQAKTAKFSDRSVTVSHGNVNLWNTLLDNVKKANFFALFKCSLNIHLFHILFKWVYQSALDFGPHKVTMHIVLKKLSRWWWWWWNNNILNTFSPLVAVLICSLTGIFSWVAVKEFVL